MLAVSLTACVSEGIDPGSIGSSGKKPLQWEEIKALYSGLTVDDQNGEVRYYRSDGLFVFWNESRAYSVSTGAMTTREDPIYGLGRWFKMPEAKSHGWLCSSYGVKVPVKGIDKINCTTVFHWRDAGFYDRQGIDVHYQGKITKDDQVASQKNTKWLKAKFLNFANETGHVEILDDYLIAVGEDAEVRSQIPVIKSEYAVARKRYEERMVAQREASRGLAAFLLGTAVAVMQNAAEVCRNNPSGCSAANSNVNVASQDTKTDIKNTDLPKTKTRNSVKSVVKSGEGAGGNPIYRIDCESGSEKYVMRKEDKWTDSLGASFSNRTWSLSLEEFAKTICE
jgi:hypothetical protein